MTSARPADIERLIGELAESDDERELMSRAADLLAYAAEPASVPSGLRARVMAAVGEGDAQFSANGFNFARAALLPWITLAPGVEVKILHEDPATGARTVLIRMAPNTAFPPHGHQGIEDLYQIEGDAWVGDVYMGAGDYCRAPDGTEHNDVRSGALGILAVMVQR